MVLMGIDVGTTGCKVLVFSENGTILASDYQEYSLISLGGGQYELSPEAVMAGVLTCIRSCCTQTDGTAVTALAVSSQGEAAVFLDGNGKALTNFYVSFDTRSKEECRWLKEHIGETRIAAATGLPIHTMFTLPKILWVKNHRPELYEKTATILCVADFIAHYLGGRPAMDHSLASRTMLFNPAADCWDHELAESCGLDIDKMPELCPPGTPVGYVSAAVAAQCGLSPRCQIVSGGHDQICCSLGTGAFEPGTVVNSMGTTDTMLEVADHFTHGDQQTRYRIPCGSYCLSGRFANHSFVLSTGAVLKWFKKQVLHTDLSYTQLNGKAAAVDGPTGIFLVPHFAGSGTPYLDPGASGAILGLTLDSDDARLYKSIFEGVSYELRINLENLKNAGIGIHSIRCIGGGARSDTYLQIKADILKTPIIKMKTEEAGCVGAALLAAKGSEPGCDLKDLSDRFTAVEKYFEPQQANTAAYDALFRRYRTIYQTIREI